MIEIDRNFKWSKDTLTISVYIQPKATSSEFIEMFNDHFKIRVNAPPVDGKANKALIDFIAMSFSVSKSMVSITQGEASRYKKVQIVKPGRIPDWANCVASSSKHD